MTVTTTRAGGEFQVNTQALDSQSNAVVAALGNGGFVIAWEDRGAVGTDTSRESIKAQIFAADGSPVGGEISVNTTTANSQASASITVLANGNFVVGWNDFSESSPDAPFTGGDVRAQVFTPAGVRVGTELRLNTVTGADQGALDIAATADGFVAVWQDRSGIGGDADGYGIKGQRFTAAGAPIGAEFLVNTAITGFQTLPAVAVGADGRFMVTWQTAGEGFDITQVSGQMFNPDGTRLGQEFTVNSDSTGLQTNSRVVATAGGYFVTWSDNSGGGNFAYNVEGARFDSLGQRLGTDQLINAPATAIQIGGFPFVTPDGGFIVPYTSRNVAGDPGNGISARVYDADGPLTGEFGVNATTLGGQIAATGAVLADGTIVFAWTHQSSEQGDGSGESIRAQRFTIASTTTGAGNVNGTFGVDQLTGSDGRDYLRGGSGADVLTALGGDDELDGGAGDDLLIGGGGSDAYYVDSQGDVIVETDFLDGADIAYASVSYYLYANVDMLFLEDRAGAAYGVGNDLSNIIDGNAFANLLLGGANDDLVYGYGGNDALFGESGNDQLYGFADIDYLVGGTGNDSLFGGAAADALYGEDGDDMLVGGDSFDTDILVGGAGNDLLDGASGLGDYDLMDGGAGDDVYLVDTPDDLTFEATGGGTDTVRANIIGAGYYLYANTENLVLEGNTPFGVGNELTNTLTGNAIGNYLLGGAGNDVLNGKGGGDVLFGEAGADTFVFERGTGGDVIGDFQAGIDKIQLTGLGFADFAALQTVFVEVGGTTAINLGQGDFVVINGVGNAALTAADFILG